MSSNVRVNSAGVLIAIYVALGLMSLLGVPEPLAGFLQSDRAIYWLQGLAGTTAVILLWSVAWNTAAQHGIARDAIRQATERADDLEKRVAEAEAKLAQALDEGIINWAPAYERLTEESEARIFAQEQRVTGLLEMERNQLHQVFNSARRQLQQGTFERDETTDETRPE